MYRHFRNVVLNSLKTAKRDYFTGLILENKKKPKLMWRCLKELLPGKSMSSPKGVLVEGQKITDPKCKANAFNKYFTSIGKELTSRLSPAASFTPPKPPEIPAFTFPTVTPDFIEQQGICPKINLLVWIDCLADYYA